MNSSHKKRKARRGREKLDRRAAILDAARTVFLAKGFGPATVDEIAELCSLAKGTIYLYFRSKEEIYACILQEGLAILKDAMERAPGKEKGVEAALRGLLAAYKGFYEKHGGYFRAIFLSEQPYCADKVSEEIMGASVELSRGCFNIVSSVIERGMASGELRKTDPWAAANILWAMVNGIIKAYDQDRFYREEIAGSGMDKLLDAALDMAMNGLKNPKRRG